MGYPNIQLHNFRAIRGTLSLDLSKRFDIYIGEQATGKSTLAKSVFFFSSIMMLFVEYAAATVPEKKEGSELFLKGWRQKLSQRFAETFDGALEQESLLKYEYAEGFSSSIRLGQKGEIEISFSTKLHQMFSLGAESALSAESDDQSMYAPPQVVAYRAMLDKFPEFFSSPWRSLYIPAGRINNDVISAAAAAGAVNHFDFPEKQFITAFYRARRQFSSSVISSAMSASTKRNYNRAIKLFESVLKGTYLRKDDSDFIVSKDGSPTPLSLASSGQQEMLSLGVLLLNQLAMSRYDLIIIEEPEAHLFPYSQKTLMELIALVSNITECTVLITTHSPYILTSAHLQVLSSTYESPRQNENEKKTGYILEPMFRIPASQLSAYRFSVGEDGGFAYKSIEENGLIDAASIDEVSDYFANAIYKLVSRG